MAETVTEPTQDEHIPAIEEVEAPVETEELAAEPVEATEEPVHEPVEAIEEPVHEPVEAAHEITEEPGELRHTGCRSNFHASVVQQLRRLRW